MIPTSCLFPDFGRPFAIKICVILVIIRMKVLAEKRKELAQTIFGIAVDRNSDGFGLKLAGDFDGTSAHELIYAIKKLPEDGVKLYIYTNSLKTIHPFGLDIFHKFMRSLNGHSAKIVFTGNSASQLSPGNSQLTS